MKRWSLFASLLMIILLLFSTTAAATAQEATTTQESGTTESAGTTRGRIADPTYTLRVIFTGNVYGHVQQSMDQDGTVTELGYAALRTFVREQAATDNAGTVVLDGGNLFWGTPFAAVDLGQDMANIVKEIGYDAILVGDGDLSYGTTTLEALAAQSGAQLMANDLLVDGQPRYGASFITTLRGISVGVIGVTPPDYASSVHNAKNNLSSGDKESLAASVQKSVDTLRANGCEVVIAMTKASSDWTTADLASGVKGLDFIFATGGSTGLTAKNGAVILTVGDNLSQVALLTVKKTGEQLSFTPEILAASKLSSYQEDSTLAQTITQMVTTKNEQLASVIRNTDMTWNGDQDQVTSSDTNLARLISDAYLSTSGADIALVCGGDIKTSLPTGDITKADVMSVLPYQDTLVTKTLSGQMIWDALEQSLGQGGSSFPHFAGMEVQYETVGDQQQVVRILVDGKSLNVDKEYLVAMSDFTASGGYGLTMFSEVAAGESYGITSNIVSEYLKNASDEMLTAADQDVRLTMDNLFFSSTSFIVLLVVIIVVAAVLVYLLVVRRRRQRIF